MRQASVVCVVVVMFEDMQETSKSQMIDYFHKAICSEAGLMALRERRMRVQMADFRAARERVLKTKSEGEPETRTYFGPER